MADNKTDHNSVANSWAIYAKKLEKWGKGQEIKKEVPRRGFEPLTSSLGNCCSILLSYRGMSCIQNFSDTA